ncbi:Delta(4)-3-oxosteroid 5beta-reductase [Ranunculus cassubicifolius]
MEPKPQVALIVGVTGMLGVSLCEELKNPTALGGPWAVYGVARRSMPTWFNSSLVERYIECDVIDFDATQVILSPFSNEITHLFWLMRKGCPTEEENVIVNSKMVDNVLKSLQYLGPISDPILSTQVQPHEAPFVEDMPRLPFPNFYYALEDLLASYSPKFTWSIHRSSIILGASGRSGQNALLTFIAYALICKHEGAPFRFPGNKFMWEHFCDASDANLLAEQQIWAVVTEKAKNQAFNCTNGDMFTWKRFWTCLCEVLGVEFVPFDERDEYNWVEDMKRKEPIWDAIVEENKLEKLKLEEVACFDACQVVLNFKIQHVCSMTKTREFGFEGFRDSFKSVRGCVRKLQEMNIIPKQL